ncbi:hypothetical protein [Nocardioides sp. B-3]|uniref:hypothetical protein n=1 Tax=Nocardioides sp. B-3 TaxID=2895565 RepID=UPI0021521D45|nr:hypothetical protein [Nocardioides sp. B-3]UUZ57842.1 hypothetical protein LP418_15735 [Nocardioides sp. B-3]
MSEQQPPPPGWSAPPPGPPTQPPPARSYVPRPAPYAAAHKPGAIPLRPLGPGDMYDAAFKIIRFNPRATVGSAVLVAAVAMAIPLLATAVPGAVLDLSMTNDLVLSDGDPSGSVSGEDVAGLIGVFGSLMLGAMLRGIGLILVGGMIAHVVAAAATGHKLTLGRARAATHGKRWRLIGLTLLLGPATTMLIALYALTRVVVAVTASGWQVPVVYGVVTVPAFIAFVLWFWVRVYYLPVPALMLEPIGVLGAVGRGFHLTRSAFWRTFGIALLTYVIAQVAGSMLSMPISPVSRGRAPRRCVRRDGRLLPRPRSGHRLGDHGRLRGAVHHVRRDPAVHRPADAPERPSTSS